MLVGMLSLGAGLLATVLTILVALVLVGVVSIGTGFLVTVLTILVAVVLVGMLSLGAGLLAADLTDLVALVLIAVVFGCSHVLAAVHALAILAGVFRIGLVLSIGAGLLAAVLTILVALMLVGMLSLGTGLLAAVLTILVALVLVGVVSIGVGHVAADITDLVAVVVILVGNVLPLSGDGQILGGHGCGNLHIPTKEDVAGLHGISQRRDSGAVVLGDGCVSIITGVHEGDGVGVDLEGSVADHILIPGHARHNLGAVGSVPAVPAIAGGHSRGGHAKEVGRLTIGSVPLGKDISAVHESDGVVFDSTADTFMVIAVVVILIADVVTAIQAPHLVIVFKLHVIPTLDGAMSQSSLAGFAAVDAVAVIDTIGVSPLVILSSSNGFSTVDTVTVLAGIVSIAFAHCIGTGLLAAVLTILVAVVLIVMLSLGTGLVAADTTDLAAAEGVFVLGGCRHFLPALDTVAALAGVDRVADTIGNTVVHAIIALVIAVTGLVGARFNLTVSAAAAVVDLVRIVGHDIIVALIGVVAGVEGAVSLAALVTDGQRVAVGGAAVTAVVHILCATDVAIVVGVIAIEAGAQLIKAIITQVIITYFVGAVDGIRIPMIAVCPALVHLIVGAITIAFNVSQIPIMALAHSILSSVGHIAGDGSQILIPAIEGVDGAAVVGLVGVTLEGRSSTVLVNFLSGNAVHDPGDGVLVNLENRVKGHILGHGVGAAGSNDHVAALALGIAHEGAAGGTNQRAEHNAGAIIISPVFKPQGAVPVNAHGELLHIATGTGVLRRTSGVVMGQVGGNNLFTAFAGLGLGVGIAVIGVGGGQGVIRIIMVAFPLGGQGDVLGRHGADLPLEHIAAIRIDHGVILIAVLILEVQELVAFPHDKDFFHMRIGAHHNVTIIGDGFSEVRPTALRAAVQIPGDGEGLNRAAFALVVFRVVGIVTGDVICNIFTTSLTPNIVRAVVIGIDALGASVVVGIHRSNGIILSDLGGSLIIAVELTAGALPVFHDTGCNTGCILSLHMGQVVSADVERFPDQVQGGGFGDFLAVVGLLAVLVVSDANKLVAILNKHAIFDYDFAEAGTEHTPFCGFIVAKHTFDDAIPHFLAHSFERRSRADLTAVKIDAQFKVATFTVAVFAGHVGLIGILFIPRIITCVTIHAMMRMKQIRIVCGADTLLTCVVGGINVNNGISLGDLGGSLIIAVELAAGAEPVFHGTGCNTGCILSRNMGQVASADVGGFPDQLQGSAFRNSFDIVFHTEGRLAALGAHQGVALPFEVQHRRGPVGTASSSQLKGIGLRIVAIQPFLGEVLAQSAAIQINNIVGVTVNFNPTAFIVKPFLGNDQLGNAISADPFIGNPTIVPDVITNIRPVAHGLHIHDQVLIGVCIEGMIEDSIRCIFFIHSDSIAVGRCVNEVDSHFDQFDGLSGATGAGVFSGAGGVVVRYCIVNNIVAAGPLHSVGSAILIVLTDAAGSSMDSGVRGILNDSRTLRATDSFRYSTIAGLIHLTGLVVCSGFAFDRLTAGTADKAMGTVSIVLVVTEIAATIVNIGVLLASDGFGLGLGPVNVEGSGVGHALGVATVGLGGDFEGHFRFDGFLVGFVLFAGARSRTRSTVIAPIVRNSTPSMTQRIAGGVDFAFADCFSALGAVDDVAKGGSVFTICLGHGDLLGLLGVVAQFLVAEVADVILGILVLMLADRIGVLDGQGSGEAFAVFPGLTIINGNVNYVKSNDILASRGVGGHREGDNRQGIGGQVISIRVTIIPGDLTIFLIDVACTEAQICILDLAQNKALRGMHLGSNGVQIDFLTCFNGQNHFLGFVAYIDFRCIQSRLISYIVGSGVLDGQGSGEAFAVFPGLTIINGNVNYVKSNDILASRGVGGHREGDNRQGIGGQVISIRVTIIPGDLTIFLIDVACTEAQICILDLAQNKALRGMHLGSNGVQIDFLTCFNGQNHFLGFVAYIDFRCIQSRLIRYTLVVRRVCGSNHLETHCQSENEYKQSSEFIHSCTSFLINTRGDLLIPFQSCLAKNGRNDFGCVTAQNLSIAGSVSRKDLLRT